ncbi:hypothetical protein [Bacillus solimangrovi]|uniref:Uncharacterized protein n=1 Tax=Bacillus solimangrovi TaxID=1305675 RepID=A0A1E5LBB5_9BACI|nr:hypothetical protein [Bacillus solimangrovi]OEH91377.1 hypothetical protein BFG57_05795 [Bacillus solimangrovi]
MERIELLTMKWSSTVNVNSSLEIIHYIRTLIGEFQQDYPKVVKESLILNLAELVDILLAVEKKR